VRAFAEEFGLPIAIKAAFGGGGRGLKVVWELDSIEESFDSAVRESQAAFGRGECFVERFLVRPRHVEAQVLADGRGTVIVVGTRDCSLQRRNQKLVEEAPAPFLTPAQSEQIYTSAKAICLEAGYSGAGTVEYLVADDGSVSFLEVNTRLQVEHPVTEETSGIDLVLAQFAIADGGPLPIMTDPQPRGHSFEFRINAEDPGRGFLPSPGTVTLFAPPTGPGVRVDTGVQSGDTIPGQFDSLLAKLIVTGADRPQALRRARRALAEFTVEGVATVLPFHRAVASSPDFTATDRLGVHTGWIETDFGDRLAHSPEFSDGAASAARVAALDHGRNRGQVARLERCHGRRGRPGTCARGHEDGVDRHSAPHGRARRPAGLGRGRRGRGAGTRHHHGLRAVPGPVGRAIGPAPVPKLRR
jgi:acetyl-CoA/propionyl-CoA carboxylase biotin carboxyl carrier protein